MDDTAHLIKHIGKDIEFTIFKHSDGIPTEVNLRGECIGIDPRPLGCLDGDYLVIRVGVHPATMLHTVPVKHCKL